MGLKFVCNRLKSLYMAGVWASTAKFYSIKDVDSVGVVQK